MGYIFSTTEEIEDEDIEEEDIEDIEEEDIEDEDTEDIEDLDIEEEDKDEIEKLHDIIANIDGNNSATQIEAAQSELDEYANLGNAGEECDLTNVWVSPVAFEPVRDLNLLLALAEAKGACADNLDQI